MRTGSPLNNVRVRGQTDPYTQHKRDDPYTQHKRDDPYTQHKRDDPHTQHKRDDPYTQHTRDDPYTQHKRDGAPLRNGTTVWPWELGSIGEKGTARAEIMANTVFAVSLHRGENLERVRLDPRSFFSLGRQVTYFPGLAGDAFPCVGR